MIKTSISTCILGFISLCFCAEPLLAQQVKSGADQIARHFPGYHILALRERESATRRFLTEHRSMGNGSSLRADFNGDGKADYAFLLKSKTSADSKFVVFLCRGDECAPRYELDVTNYAQSAFLTLMREPQVVSPSEALPGSGTGKRLDVNAIEISYFEKGKVVVRWDKSKHKFEEVQTED